MTTGIQGKTKGSRALLMYMLCAAMLLTAAAPVSATTLLALIDRKHHRVVLAADSMLIRGVGQDTQITSQACKIIATPGCTYGMAGLFNKNYPVFHLKEMADQACGLTGDLKHRADAFLQITREPVTEVAQYIQQNEPEFYGELTSKNSGELIMVIFAGTENGNSVIYGRGYKLNPKGGVIPVSVDTLENHAGIGFFAGANQEIADYVKTHKDWDKMDKVKAARKFLELEIKAHPDWVGPPLTIMTINKLDQQKWISPGECGAPADVQQTKTK